MLFESTCVYSFTSFSETRTTFLERFLLLHTLQVLIWTLHASDIRTRPLFQKIIQNSLSLKSFSFAFLKLLKCSFSKFGALFVVSHIIIIFYFFVVSLDNIPPPTHCHESVWSCFALMVNMSSKLLIWARNFDVISHQWKTDHYIDFGRGCPFFSTGCSLFISV